MIATERKRGRPRAFDAETGLDIALRAFAQRGFDAVGVADLCALMGVKPPSLYAAYGSKRDLFDRAVARYGAGTAAVYDAAIAQATDLPDLRRRVLTAALDLYLRDAGLGCLVISTLSSTADPDLRDALSDLVAARRAGMIARAIALGATRPEAEAEVMAISVAMMGLSAAARAGLGAEPLRAALDRLI
ncbi:TetR/AcrR family transcriptional regulator [Jannaschia donghaensis]|uniref:HTH-type transcriptional repressor BdcR n=1 Tax=Jannaschia donghaensis TaxID=420998 RepID=A0A0M6YIY2_9RHOB|nr:TetR/AcrR family transcriptional regulator [Jannaschia donghaensis]CTQ49739.1 HTH-type transcriptional repressor BdcR [Jannaschia donghaensis]